MKETHDLVANNTSSIALLNILCSEGHKAVDKYVNRLPDGKPDKNVEVELWVNGKPVSWQKAMAGMLEIRKQEVDRLVGNRLANILSCDGIKQTVDQINNIKWELRNKIEQLAGEKIEWPEEY